MTPPTEPPDEPLSRQEAATWADKLNRWADELDGAPDELDVSCIQDLLATLAVKLERVAENRLPR